MRGWEDYVHSEYKSQCSHGKILAPKAIPSGERGKSIKYIEDGPQVGI